MHTHVHTYIYPCIQIHIHTYMHTYIHTYAHTYSRMQDSAMSQGIWYILTPHGSQRTDTDKADKVSCPADCDISDLKELITEKNSNKLKGIDPGDLVIQNSVNSVCLPQDNLSAHTPSGTGQKPFLVFFPTRPGNVQSGCSHTYILNVCVRVFMYVGP